MPICGDTDGEGGFLAGTENQHAADSVLHTATLKMGEIRWNQTDSKEKEN
jgi:hypothetical protein